MAILISTGFFMRLFIYYYDNQVSKCEQFEPGGGLAQLLSRYKVRSIPYVQELGLHRFLTITIILC